MELSWDRPNSGKWTVYTSRGRSIVDYVFVNQRARGLVVEYRVWEDDYIAGSDHRLVSCVVKPRAASLPVGSLTQRVLNSLTATVGYARETLKTPNYVQQR